MIQDAIRKMVAGMINATICSGTVKTVDTDRMTCEIDLTTGPDLPNVRLRASIDGVAKGLLIIPKINSVVLIARIDGKIESSFVVAYGEIERMDITTVGELKLNGDSNGGLPLSEKISEVDNAIKGELNTLKNIIGGWVPVPNDGGAALKAALLGWQSSIANTPKIDYESKKVKHGS